MARLKLSPIGKKDVQQVRKEQGWTVDDPRWLEKASKVLEPEHNWENTELYAAGASLSTWKRFLSGEPIDASVFKAFCEVLGLDWQKVVERNLNLPLSSATQIPKIPLFFGRGYELATLTKAIEEGARLLAITGIGGIGKTALAAKLADALQKKFQQTLWFSFHLTPPAMNTPPVLPTNTLLVFDGWDAILGGDVLDGLRQRAGQYRSGYERYAEFLRTVAQTAHTSCVILTSREQPEGLNILNVAGVVIFPLSGLKEGAIELLQYHNLTFYAQQWIALVRLYGGNPLFLNMAADIIHKLFAGNVGELLASGTIITSEFEPLVREWLKNISEVEKTLIKFLATEPQGFTRKEILRQATSDAAPVEKILMKFLATEPQGFTLEEIRLQFPGYAGGDILAALLTLQYRALVETIKDGKQERFFLPPAIHLQLQLTSYAAGDILAALLSLQRRALVETVKDDDEERFFLQTVILKCVRRLFS